MEKNERHEKECPQCGSEKIVRFGYKLTLRGRAQRYQCQSCAHVFCDNNNDENNDETWRRTPQGATLPNARPGARARRRARMGNLVKTKKEEEEKNESEVQTK